MATEPRQTLARYKAYVDERIKELPAKNIGYEDVNDCLQQKNINDQSISAYMTPATPQNPLIPMALVNAEFRLVPMERLQVGAVPTVYDNSTVELTVVPFVSGSPATGDYIGSYIENTGFSMMAVRCSGYVNVVPDNGSELIVADYMLDTGDGNGFQPLGFSLPATQTNQVNINITMPEFPFTLELGWKMALGVKCSSASKSCTLVQSFFTVSNAPNFL